MSGMLRNLKVGRAILSAKITESNHLILLIDTKDSCTIRSLDYDTQKPISGFKIAVDTKNRFGFGVTDDAVFVLKSNKIETHFLENQQLAYSCDLAPHLHQITAFKASRNGYYIAAGDSAGAVVVFHPKIDNPKRVIKDLMSGVVSLVFDRDNRQLAIATNLGDIKIVDIGNSEISWDLICGEKASKMAFSSDYLMVGDKDGLLRFFARSDYDEKKIKNLECGKIVAIESCFDDRGAIVASSGGRIFIVSLVDLARNELLIDVCNDEIQGISYDDKTKRLVVYSTIGNVFYYDLSQDRELLHLFAPKEEVCAIETKPQKEHIKVLSVDDSVTMRRVIVSAVKNCTKNAVTFEANDGKEALKILKENPDMDVMFLDWNMPTMSGEEVAQTIKNADLYPSLQIIMATTEGGKDKVTKMLRLGVAGYLVKPFRPDAITKIMSKLAEVVSKK